MKQRVLYLDISRSLAILLVVVGHLIQYNLTGENARVLFNFIYCFHMPLFMFLSGYVASLNSTHSYSAGFVGFMSKKALRLLLPFAIWGLIVNPFILGSKPVYDFFKIAALLFLQPDTGAWFLLSLFFIQLYLYTAQCLAKHLEKIFNCHEVSLLVSFSIILFVVIIANYLCALSFYTPQKHLMMFFTGYLFYKYEDRVPKWLYPVMLILFALLVPFYDNDDPLLILVLVASISISSVILYVSRMMSVVLSMRMSYLLGFCGRYSIQIYLTHFVLIHILRNVIVQSDYIEVIPLFCLSFAVSIFIALLSVSLSTTISYIPYLSTLLYGQSWCGKKLK